MNPTTPVEPVEHLVTTLRERLAAMVRPLSTWLLHESPSLAEIEPHVLRLIKELGATLLAGLAALAVPVQPPPLVPCPCGQQARYLRLRPATVTTVLGPITIARP